MAIEDIGKNALQVLEKRYLAKDAEGNHTEDVAGLFRRVAAAVAAADRNYDENADTAALADSFYELMTSLRFLPNSPTLMNAGRPLGQLSACFVLADCGRTADALELVIHFLHADATAQRHAGKAGRCFALAGATAGLACTGKHLADAVFIVVHRDVQIAAANLHTLGKAHSDGRARAGTMRPKGCCAAAPPSFLTLPMFSTWLSRLPSR